ncbi:MAG TPA: DUF5698 domain-containing protein [Acidimicrobiales bacterium]|nr:DUF5698 domain-containing protein [Acidimicrobiales bacterium]
MHEIEEATVSGPSGALAGDGLTGGMAMAAMALVNVGLWTLRVAFAARGRKLLGAGVAALEAVVFAVAFSSLAASLDAPVRVVGYGLGVAAGTLVGLTLDERASRGKSEIQVVVDGDDRTLVERLRGLGWPTTWFPAEGLRGSVTVALVTVDDAQVRHVVKVVQQSVPDAFWAVQQLRVTHPGFLGGGPSPVSAADLAPPPGPRRHPPAHVNRTRKGRNSHVHHTHAPAARDRTTRVGPPARVRGVRRSRRGSTGVPPRDH